MNPEGPRSLEAFQLVLLRRPAGAPEFDAETLDRLQRDHLAFLARLRADGTIATYGPVVDQPDPALRGLALYRVARADEARAFAMQDPLVVAGRLEIEVMTFLSPPGAISAPGLPVSFG